MVSSDIPKGFTQNIPQQDIKDAYIFAIANLKEDYTELKCLPDSLNENFHFLIQSYFQMDPSDLIDISAFTNKKAGWLKSVPHDEWLEALSNEYERSFDHILSLKRRGQLPPAIMINGEFGDGRGRALLQYALNEPIIVVKLQIQINSSENEDIKKISSHENTDTVIRILSSFLPGNGELEGDFIDALNGMNEIVLKVKEWKRIGKNIAIINVTAKNYKDYIIHAHGETFESDDPDISITAKEYKQGYSKNISQFISSSGPAIGVCSTLDATNITILDGQHRSAQLWKMRKSFSVYVIPLPDKIAKKYIHSKPIWNMKE
jgi:hypothetical protein